MAFKKAERKSAKLKSAISGPSGSGKTYSALLFAKEIGTKIAVLDSEHGSASLYSHLVDFDVDELDEHAPQTYIQKISEAAAAGYDTLVIDSLSHSWMDVRTKVEAAGGWAKAGKTYSPLADRLITAILTYPGHVICTVRSKMGYEIEKNDAGKVTGMKKLGMEPVVRPDTEYDFSVWLELTREGAVNVSKTRCPAIEGNIYRREADIPKIAQTLRAWLESGAQVSPRDALAERIRFVTSEAGLVALVPELKTLSEEDRRALQPVYMARKKEFQAAVAPAGDAFE